MFLNEFETKIELAGADYNALISYEWDDQRPLIYSVEISRLIRHDYNQHGEYAPEVKRIVLDITRFLDDYQMGELMEEISTDQSAQFFESKAEAELEHQNRYRQAA